MPKITYITHDSIQYEIDADADTTVMNAAIDNLVPGIDADCGGQCSCATCHVYIDAEWQEIVGPPGEMEEGLLSINPDREVNSRLSCQINVSDELDGLVVNVPEFQM